MSLNNRTTKKIIFFKKLFGFVKVNRIENFFLVKILRQAIMLLFTNFNKKA